MDLWPSPGVSAASAPTPRAGIENQKSKIANLDHAGRLLITTFRTAVSPGGRLIRFLPTLPDSTQSMRRNSSVPKSGISWDFALHGFQITVDSDPLFSMRTIRLKVGS